MRLGEGMPCSGAPPPPSPTGNSSLCLVTSSWPEHCGQSPAVNLPRILERGVFAVHLRVPSLGSSHWAFWGHRSRRGAPLVVPMY